MIVIILFTPCSLSYQNRMLQVKEKGKKKYIDFFVKYITFISRVELLTSL